MQCITLYICYASEVIEKLALARSQFLNKIQRGAMLSSLIFSAVIQFQTRPSINCNMEKAGALELLCLLHGY